MREFQAIYLNTEVCLSREQSFKQILKTVSPQVAATRGLHKSLLFFCIPRHGYFKIIATLLLRITVPPKHGGMINPKLRLKPGQISLTRHKADLCLAYPLQFCAVYQVSLIR